MSTSVVTHTTGTLTLEGDALVAKMSGTRGVFRKEAWSKEDRTPLARLTGIQLNEESDELTAEFAAVEKELPAAKGAASMTPGGAMITALNIKPNTGYYSWVFAVGIPVTIVAGFAASSWMYDNAGFTSFGVFALVGIAGFGLTGWLAKKR